MGIPHRTALRSTLLALLWVPLSGQTIVKRYPAGSDAEGNRLSVVQQRFRKRGADEKRCIPDEQYVLEKSRDGKVVASEPVVTLCQTDDGVETEVAIAPNAISVSRNGGTHAGYNYSKTFQLSPWKPIEVDDCSIYGSGEFTSEHWDLRTLRGQAWHQPGPVEDYPDGVGICDQSLKLSTYLVVPKVPFSAATLEQARAHLGSCALSLDASGRNGFVTWGKPDPRDPVQVKLIETGDHTLIAQVIDPQRAVQAAKSWVNADHLEVWMGSALASVFQFGIPLADGPVEVGYGQPAHLPVVRRWTSTLPDGRTATMLRIELPPHEDYNNGLTVVYSQSLEGRAQKRMIATSRVKRSDPGTLGWNGSVLIHNSAGDYVACGLVQGALEITGAAKKPLEVPPPEPAR